MPATVRWSGSIVATSSIAHGGDTRGTITIFRTELVRQLDGGDVEIPIISGNAFKGRLRRLGEDLLRDVLDYDGLLPASAVHILRSGGQLTKTRAQMTGAQTQRLRDLIPHIGVFGCNVGSRPLDGCLKVGKIVPCVREMAHVLPSHVDITGGVDDVLQLETYSNHDDTHTHSFPHASPAGDATTSELDVTRLLRYDVQTMKAGTKLSTWIQVDRANPIELAFITDLLDNFASAGAIGGRISRGLGQVEAQFTPKVLAGDVEPADWRAYLRTHRDEAIDTLRSLP